MYNLSQITKFRFKKIKFDLVWFGSDAGFGLVWFGTDVGFGLVWFGLVWYRCRINFLGVLIIFEHGPKIQSLSLIKVKDFK